MDKKRGAPADIVQETDRQFLGVYFLIQRTKQYVVDRSSSSLLPDYQPTPCTGLIGSGCMCAAVGVTVQIGIEKIAKERKEDRGACVSCAER